MALLLITDICHCEELVGEFGKRERNIEEAIVESQIWHGAYYRKPVLPCLQIRDLGLIKGS